MRIDKAEITLRDIRLHAYHGVLPEEREVGTEYSITLRCALSQPHEIISKAHVSDDIAGTVDYGQIYRLVKEEMDIPSNLIENVAARIGERVLQTFSVISSVTVEIEKYNPPLSGICKSASVCIECRV